MKDGGETGESGVSPEKHADLAGRAWGWMSPAYLNAAGVIDRALNRLGPLVENPKTLLVFTADHGGGGVLPQDHGHPHPVNDAIPLGMLGGRVKPGLVSADPVRLLDIPPTVLHAFGGIAPVEYEGRVLQEAFMTEPVWLFRDPFADFTPSGR